MVDIVCLTLTRQEVQYSREGTSKDRVPENTLAVFRFVKEAFVIPNGIEKDHKVPSELASLRLVSPRQL